MRSLAPQRKKKTHTKFENLVSFEGCLSKAQKTTTKSKTILIVYIGNVLSK